MSSRTLPAFPLRWREIARASDTTAPPRRWYASSGDALYAIALVGGMYELTIDGAIESSSATLEQAKRYAGVLHDQRRRR